MSEDGWFRSALEMSYYLAVTASILIVMARKRETESSLAWTLAIIFLPFFGLAMFWLVGVRRIPRRLRAKVEHRERFSSRFPDRTRFVVDEKCPPDFEVDGAGWQNVRRLARTLGASPARGGNAVELFHRGQDAFRGIFDSVRAAKHHVHVEKFIFRHDGLGESFIRLLQQKIREGLEVRLLVDAYGSLGAWSLLRQLRQAGGQAEVFMPIFPVRKRFAPNLRNHRKIVICDGEVGFFGGLNIGEEYLGRRARSRDWCDAHVRIRGPAVWDLQHIFAEDWDFSAGELLSGEAYFPTTPCPGAAAVQIVAAGPDRDVNAIRQMYFTVITQASHRLLIASPYLVPDVSIRDALASAAFRGVEVILLTQSYPPDHWFPYWAARFYYSDLLDAGVRIFEYEAGMMHSKIIVADGLWATIGSANLDNRSLKLNFELNGVFEDPPEVRKIEDRFRQDLALSTELRLEVFERRSYVERGLEMLSRLGAPLL